MVVCYWNWDAPVRDYVVRLESGSDESSSRSYRNFTIYCLGLLKYEIETTGRYPRK